MVRGATTINGKYPYGVADNEVYDAVVNKWPTIPIKAWNVSMSKPYTKLVVTDSRLMALDI